MGLFSKKPPCPICGGKIPLILPANFEGEYICNNCYGKLDMDNDKQSNLTMRGLRDYLAYYDQNQNLKERFVISERIDFGLWDTKIIFDYQNKLLCMSKNPDKTVFEGKQLKSFTIKEDSFPLFEGSAAGIRRRESPVPERAMAMAPQIAQYAANRRMARTLDRLDDGKTNNSATVQYHNIPEPFQAFQVELHFNHPYRTLIKCDMDGPRFDNTNPDVNNYLRSYQQSIEEIEKLVAALKAVAFPEAMEQTIGSGATRTAQPSPSGDIAEEIRKYKALMEEGIISQQEFEAKKRQLLEI